MYLRIRWTGRMSDGKCLLGTTALSMVAWSYDAIRQEFCWWWWQFQHFLLWDRSRKACPQVWKLNYLYLFDTKIQFFLARGFLSYWIQLHNIWHLNVTSGLNFSQKKVIYVIVLQKKISIFFLACGNAIKEVIGLSLALLVLVIIN